VLVVCGAPSLPRACHSGVREQCGQGQARTWMRVAPCEFCLRTLCFCGPLPTWRQCVLGVSLSLGAGPPWGVALLYCSRAEEIHLWGSGEGALCPAQLVGLHSQPQLVCGFLCTWVPDPVYPPPQASTSTKGCGIPGWGKSLHSSALPSNHPCSGPSSHGMAGTPGAWD
jgi:hypothetical protein